MIDYKNRKLLKEWKKIEQANIFQSFEEFAEFYFFNGEKHCYRKYTNEPWSKDNFFFGTYEELLQFYKVDVTIPNSAIQKIGHKFNSLTVLNLFAKNETGKKIIYANCKCDCGNETVKILRDVVKGDVTICGKDGCRQKRKTPNLQNIIPIPEDIIKEHWDYELNNNIDPKTLSLKSKQLYWWKDKTGCKYQLPPCVYAKNIDTASSFPEQALFFYIKKIFPSAINRANYLTKKENFVELDIYIPPYNIGIEYDGVFWHQNRVDDDIRKNRILNEENIFVIRVREHGLPLLQHFNGIIIERNKYTVASQIDLVEIINKVISIIDVQTGKRNVKGKITQKEYENDFYSIYALVYSIPVEDNIGSTCIGKFWDKKKNGNLNPECIGATSSLPVYFKCSANHSFKLSAKNIFEKLNSDKIKIYGCNNKKGLNPCNIKLCCPFRNLSICDGHTSTICLIRKGYKLPELKCVEKVLNDKAEPIYHSTYDNEMMQSVNVCIQPFLRISFENKSAFPFYTEKVGSFWIKNGNIKKFNDTYFTNENLRKIVPSNKKMQYTYFIPYGIGAEFCEGKLILCQQLFKDEYMRGWRFYIFLIIEFDKNGNLINQQSKIVSKNNYDNLLDYRFDNENYFKTVINDILNG